MLNLLARCVTGLLVRGTSWGQGTLFYTSGNTLFSGRLVNNRLDRGTVFPDQVTRPRCSAGSPAVYCTNSCASNYWVVTICQQRNSTVEYSSTLQDETERGTGAGLEYNWEERATRARTARYSTALHPAGNCVQVTGGMEGGAALPASSGFRRTLNLVGLQF